MALSLFDRLLKSKSRTALHRRPARARLGLEALERREMLTVTSGINNGVLVVNGDSTGNTITVDHVGNTTVVNGVGFADSQIANNIQIKSGTGNDRVKILHTVNPVEIKGQDGRDTVTISDARNIAANVLITNTTGSTQLNIADTSPAHHDVVMGIDAASFGTISGLAPGATISYRASDVSAVRINTGTGGNTFTVNDTVKDNHNNATLIFGNNGNDIFTVRKTTGRLTINGGFGNDVINVGSADNKLDAIQGAVTVDGGLGGTDTLNINDQGSKTPHTYTQSATTLDRNGAARITFTGIENLHVNKGAVLGNAPQAKDLKLTPSAKKCQFATLTGRLVDTDPGDALSLTVDWGDGSKPQTSTPNRAPFSLKHRYEQAGTYTVRVIWTDNTGQSNFRDPSLVVTPRHLPAGPQAAARHRS
jgi:hypothetical protein